MTRQLHETGIAVNLQDATGLVSRRFMHLRQAQRRRRAALCAAPPPLAFASWFHIPDLGCPEADRVECAIPITAPPPSYHRE
jgi:hypothetical protein